MHLFGGQFLHDSGGVTKRDIFGAWVRLKNCSGVFSYVLSSLICLEKDEGAKILARPKFESLYYWLKSCVLIAISSKC